MKKLLYSLVTIVVIIVIVILLSSGKFSRPVETGPIKVGVIAPLTGQYGSIGESFKNAVQLAVGDDKRIEVFFEDDQFDSKLGLSAFQKLTTVDGVDLIMNVGSPTLEAITPIVNEKHIPVIQIFEAKDHKKDTVFQMLPFSYPLFSDLAKLAEQRYKRIALVYSGANDVLTTNATYFKEGLTASTTLVNETKVSANSDFRSEVTKILATNPDAVTNIFGLSDGIKFIKELNAQKGNRKIALLCDANIELAINDYIKALGTTTFEGCVSTNLPNLMTSSFKQAYQQKFNSDPLMGADWGFDALMIVKDLVAIPKDKWIAKIQSESFAGASGSVSFDENGTRTAVSERHIFKNGTFVKLEQ